MGETKILDLNGKIASNVVWFDQIQTTLPLNIEEQTALANSFLTAFANPANDMEIPPSLVNDSQPRLLFLTLSDGEHPATVVWGSGRGLKAAMEVAVKKAHLKFPDQSLVWFKIDVVQQVTAIQRRDIKRPLNLDRSLFGLAFDLEYGLAFLPEELVSNALVNSDQVIVSKQVQKYLKSTPELLEKYEKLRHNDNITLYRFNSTSIFCDSKELFSLYRGHRVFDGQKIVPDVLLNAAKAAGDYLAKGLQEDGRFLYLYRPKTDQQYDSYNILRHAGTIHALLELYEVTEDETVLATSLQAIYYLLEALEPCPDPGTGLCVVEHDTIKLGSNAVAAIALSRYTEITQDKAYLPLIVELGKRLCSIQKENGEFTHHQQSYSTGEVSPFVSGFYPGEAIFALLRIHRIYPQDQWLNAAELGLNYLMAKLQAKRETSPLPQDHWLLCSLNELFKHRPKPEYLALAGDIANAIAQSQNLNPPHIDWLGSFFQPPRSTATATRIEGLCAAYSLAKQSNNPQAAQTLLKSLYLGAAFCLQTQFAPETAMYLPDPQLVLGGFHRSLTNFEIRIDYVQHNLQGLLGVYRIITGEIE